jgi:type IV pilus assembly protein PilB
MKLRGRGGQTAELELENAVTRRIGDLLVSSGAASKDQVKAALKQQRRDHRPLGEILVSMGVRSDLVTRALIAKLGLTPLDLDRIDAQPEAVESVTSAFAREHRIFPYSIDPEGLLHVATIKPDDTALTRLVTETVRRGIRMEFADVDTIERALDRFYSVHEKVGKAVQRAVLTSVREARVQELAVLNPDAPVVQIVDLLLTQGLRDRASDIHIEPQGDRLRIRYRIDGALRDVQTLPSQLGSPLASRLKIMADMDIVDRHRAQDGQTTVNVDGRDVDIRVATMETIWGEKVVLRLLDRSRSLLPLAQLGLQDQEHQLLQRLIASPYGLFIVSGPTGSGKTTTLYAALNEKDRTLHNITTIEDPVEYQFDNINQVQINRLAGMTFANGLRAILRQDPDVILIGEVRDQETAQIAVQSALTGHMVMASLHAADAVGALFRFVDMGVQGYLLASSVVGVVAQRLVRVNCVHCSAEIPVLAAERDFYHFVRGRDPGRNQMAGAGCRRCSGTGFYDRTGVFECMGIDEQVRAMIVSRASQQDIREYARGQGMRTLQDAVCDLVDDGKTTIAEAMRTVYVL